jgi:hypothetical protein
MLHHELDKLKMITVCTDKVVYYDGSYALLGWIRWDYVNHVWLAELTEKRNFGRFPRRVQVKSVRNGFKFLIKAETVMKKGRRNNAKFN